LVLMLICRLLGALVGSGWGGRHPTCMSTDAHVTSKEQHARSTSVFAWAAALVCACGSYIQAPRRNPACWAAAHPG